jgi:hypothetical protein
MLGLDKCGNLYTENWSGKMLGLSGEMLKELSLSDFPGPRQGM